MTLKRYEGMFLVEPVKASTNWDEVTKHIEEVITKHGGKVIQSIKWAERKLAYPIKKQKRGTYVLVDFEAPPASIDKIKADSVLSEIILRALIVIPSKISVIKPIEEKINA